MDSSLNTTPARWWSEGDFPVRQHNTRITWLLDGRTTLFEMCLYFLKARHTLYLANWGLSWDMQLVRGPDHPNAGRAFSDAGVNKVRELAGSDEARTGFFVFTLASSESRPAPTNQHDASSTHQETHYRPIYVHAKVAIVDDTWATIGSANLNNRGMRDDTEINMALLDSTLAGGLRLLLQGEHLNLATDDELRITSRLLSKKTLSPQEQAQAEQVWQRLLVQLEDPYQALRLMQQRAIENLVRYKAQQPLLGHLLPYLTAEEAQQQGLAFEEKHGWIEEHT